MTCLIRRGRLTLEGETEGHGGGGAFRSDPQGPQEHQEKPEDQGEEEKEEGEEERL